MKAHSKSRGKRRKGQRKIIAYLGGAILTLGLIVSYFLFAPITGSLTQGEYLFIHTGSDFESVKKALAAGGFVKDTKRFELLAKETDYPNRIRPGRYHISPGMSNWQIVRLLRSGKQSPVKLVITKLRTQADFVRLLSTKLEADSTILWQMLRDDNYLAQFGLDSNTALCAVMPNTYEFYWNTSADKAFRKIEATYSNFWNKQRQAAARALNLSPQQAVTLASIVSEESNKRDEQPNIARVYLNRLAKGMKLQADPTAKFASGDFALKRITSAQTSIPSAYNTYYVTGLPPGPICTPDGRTIDAVLAAPKNDYLYFCAKADFSGYHSFAATYAEHLTNAQAYQKALNAQSIH